MLYLERLRSHRSAPPSWQARASSAAISNRPNNALRTTVTQIPGRTQAHRQVGSFVFQCAKGS